MKKLLSLGLVLVSIVVLSACSGTSSMEVAASTVAIDVNPSVVLELDEDDKVINIILNNEDAEIILGDMDLIGVDYNVAINALIGSMVTNGYISEFTNSVLLSISSEDQLHEDELMALLAQKVEEVLTANEIEGSVITQELEIEIEEEELAEQLGISEAKADLILDLVELDPRLVIEELALLSINELNLLLEAKNYVIDGVEKTGNASTLGLISIDEAYQAALAILEVDGLTVVEFEVELEQEDGVMVYEVEIETDVEEYEILINAEDGTEYIEVDDDNDDEDDFPVDALTEEEIKALLATELGIDFSLVEEVEIEQEMDNGVAYYEVEFEYNGEEYELEIEAVTGEVFTNSMDEEGYDFDDDDDMDDEDEVEDTEETDEDDEEETE